MARLAAALLLFCLTSGSRSPAENKKTCPDGDHYETDVKQIAIQYEGSSFAGTLSSLNVLGARLTVTPQKLQEAALATQQWNEFVKGLVTGYNNCAITKEQYNQGLQR